ncbi:hypothetical protein I7I50_11808 [Histoplasma capsulatum G186AR]|uniref:Uncharacterized protein n=1 Tax=Ajellomyces capsulatus TaxID=5037 RepID=A0A8H7Z5S5_AJECA|nr:hypothetical protein I7I52_03046 [Histoplasma capsulatum]QSS70242.1 hypothetical protein I7I50_11808 [Histoplasma capsulatum G186AR]
MTVQVYAMFSQAHNLLEVDCLGRSSEYYYPSSLHLEVVQKAVSALAVVAFHMLLAPLLDLGVATLGRADEISRHEIAVPRWGLRMLPRETITIYHHPLCSSSFFSPRCKRSRQLSPERHLSPSHPCQLPSFSSADDVPPQPRAKRISHWIAGRKPRHVMH